MSQYRKILAISLCILSGCTASLPVRTFSNQEAAGTVQVAIQSIAPFDEDFMNQLQPNLTLTDEQATGAIALTRIQEIQRFRALLIEAGIALPTDTSSFTKTLAANGTTSVTGTAERKPGDATSIPTPPTAVAQTLQPFASPDSKITTDQSLALRANMALRQEVALLNRQVRDAAVSRGTRPYVVRFLVTLNPSSRRQPYNAFADVSLFATKGESELTSEVRNFFNPRSDDVRTLLQRVNDPSIRSQLKELVEFVASSDVVVKKTVDALLERAPGYCHRSVEMVPLFVTDNLESSADSIALQSTLSVGAGATGLIQNIAARVAGRFQQNDQSRAKTNGFNALYSVGRVSTNTIEARLGAFSSGVDFETVPRTYNITILALVPTLAGVLDEYKEAALSAGDRTLIRPLAGEVLACRELAFASRYHFTDGRTGRTLPSVFERSVVSDLERVRSDWHMSSTSAQDLRQLMSFAETDDYNDFRKKLVEASPSKPEPLSNAYADLERRQSSQAEHGNGVEPLAQMLWLDLVNVARKSGRAYGRISVPQPSFEMFRGDASATIIDDGKGTATVTLFGAHDLTSTALDAKLEFGADPQHTFYAASSTVSRDGRRASFQFDSPTAFSGGTAPTKLRLTVMRGGGARAFQSALERDYVAETGGDGIRRARLTILPKPAPPEKPKATPPALMSVAVDHIILAPDAQSGSFSVSFAPTDPKKPQKVRFMVKGADVTATSPDTTVDGIERITSATGTYVLSLRNIAANDLITITAFAVKDDNTRGDTIGEQTVRVLSLPPAKKEAESSK